ncbi:MAG: M6 family metalloprotease domain-containing protein [Bacteroidales bacterium]|nr:M6 family metalloprotease domain-containing protein [Bacteroidales bacterium]
MRRILSTLLFLLLLFQQALAIPSDPRPRVMTQPDGSQITVRLIGDEYHHYFLSQDSIPLVRVNDFFYYAQTTNGEWASSGLRAHDAALRSADELALIQQMDRPQMLRQQTNLWQTKREKMGAPRRMPRSTPTNPKRGPVPTTGQQRALAILVSFPQTSTHDATDFSYDDPRQLFDDMLNKQGFDFDGATGSVRDYFLAASNGQYDLTFDVFGPVVLSRDISFYGQNLPGGDLNAWNMVVEACEALDGQIDFSQYDRNLDGVVDNIYVFYAGMGEATGGREYTIWQHAGEVETLSDGQTFTFDGVRINRYACSNELRPILNTETGKNENHFEGIGTICHEYTHVLDFPDLYDVTSSGYFTPGSWSLMDVGCHLNNARTPCNFTAYERMCMGWLNPEVLDATPRDIVLETVDNNVGLRINSAKPEEEYFILENRQQQGWDQYLPGHGLLVWHITFDNDLWVSNKVNSNPYFQGIDLVEADGIRSEDSRAGDAFPGTAGITSLTAETNPGLRDQEGNAIQIPLTNIREKNGVIQFAVCGGRPQLPLPADIAIENLTPMGFTATWTPSAGATYYEADVFVQTEQGREYVEGYRTRRVDQPLLEVEGLQAERTYQLVLRARNASQMSEQTEPVSITTPALSFAYTRPTALAASEVTASGFTANWSPLEGAERYALDVLQRGMTEAYYQTVDFTDGIKAMPEGWTTNAKMVLSVAGSYGNAAPSLSLAADNAYIESPIFADGLRSISLWQRERNAPCGKNYVTLEVMLPQVNQWMALDTLLLTDTNPQAGTTILWLAETEQATSATDAAVRPVRIPKGSRALRLTYHREGSGGLAIDDIVIGHGGAETYTPLNGFTRIDAGTGTSFTVTGLTLTPTETLYYRVYGHDGATYSLPSLPQPIVYDPTGIAAPTTQPEGPTRWYDLSGRPITGNRPERPGIYINNRGEKRIKK